MCQIFLMKKCFIFLNYAKISANDYYEGILQHFRCICLVKNDFNNSKISYDDYIDGVLDYDI